MPQVIVIDEIGTKLEAMAASTIAQRGIQLVATAHGVTIENLIMNPSLEMLVGGIQVNYYLLRCMIGLLQLLHKYEFSDLFCGLIDVAGIIVIQSYSKTNIICCPSGVRLKTISYYVRGSSVD